MASTFRMTSGPIAIAKIWQLLASLWYASFFSTFGSGAIGNGTTAGRLRTTASATGRVAGVEVTKASTDDLWNLSGETALAAGQYRAYWLYVNAAGTASIAAGSIASTAAAALLALPDLAEDKCVLGAYVAGPSTNFTAALAAQGTIYNRIPDGAMLPGDVVYVTPQQLTLIKP